MRKVPPLRCAAAEEAAPLAHTHDLESYSLFLELEIILKASRAEVGTYRKIGSIYYCAEERSLLRTLSIQPESCISVLLQRSALPPPTTGSFALFSLSLSSIVSCTQWHFCTHFCQHLAQISSPDHIGGYSKSNQTLTAMLTITHPLYLYHRQVLFFLSNSTST